MLQCRYRDISLAIFAVKYFTVLMGMQLNPPVFMKIASVVKSSVKILVIIFHILYITFWNNIIMFWLFCQPCIFYDCRKYIKK